MTEFLTRTEDLQENRILDCFQAIGSDDDIISALKGRTPVLLEGSRGTGKSLLLRVAEQQLLSSFSEERVMPVYITFARAPRVAYAEGQTKFRDWMIATIAQKVSRRLDLAGFGGLPSTTILSGGSTKSEVSRVEAIAQQFESSGRQSGTTKVNTDGLPNEAELLDAVEELCDSTIIDRICLFFDEAAHIHIPQQQEQFFTLFRALRSSRINCKAAVYPGVTYYGKEFQLAHDARLIRIERDATTIDYTTTMEAMILRQAKYLLSQAEQDRIEKAIDRNRPNFDALAYASGGNPRVLLSLVSEAPKLRASEVNKAIRNFFGHTVLNDHDRAGDKFESLSTVVRWGRTFLERDVVPRLLKRARESSERRVPMSFWVDHDAPNEVRYALQLLEYTGLIRKDAAGIAGRTKGTVGTRYSVSLGLLIAAYRIKTRSKRPRTSRVGLRRPIRFRMRPAVLRSAGTHCLRFVAKWQHRWTRVSSSITCSRATSQS